MRLRAGLCRTCNVKCISASYYTAALTIFATNDKLSFKVHSSRYRSFSLYLHVDDYPNRHVLVHQCKTKWTFAYIGRSLSLPHLYTKKKVSPGDENHRRWVSLRSSDRPHALLLELDSDELFDVLCKGFLRILERNKLRQTLAATNQARMTNSTGTASTAPAAAAAAASKTTAAVL